MITRKEKLMAKVKELIKTNKEKGIEKDYGNMTLKQLEIEVNFKNITQGRA